MSTSAEIHWVPAQVPPGWHAIPEAPYCYLFIENGKLEFRYIGPRSTETYRGRA